MNTLITGGLGYIGSHIAIRLKKKAVIIDNLSNSCLDYKKILPHAKVYIKDINFKSLKEIFTNHKIKNVIHLAGFKSVEESISSPLKYYENNINSTLTLLNCMNQFNVNNLVFSSSATVYGHNNLNPLKENSKLSSTSPYGSTKLLIEKMITEFVQSKKEFKAITLRYFNPIGANVKKKLSEKPLGMPQNLMPMIIKSILEKKSLSIYGNNYNTKDGTCIRDYIHVEDLALAHILALKKMKLINSHKILNIGLGKGVSVYELIKIFEKSNKVKVDYKFCPRRPGDIPISYADNKKARAFLNWKPIYNYKQMCIDSWESAIKKN